MLSISITDVTVCSVHDKRLAPRLGVIVVNLELFHTAIIAGLRNR
jgi:hypothetical protein